MLVVDDVLFFPIRSLFWIFREVHNAAGEQVASEATDLTAELSDLYMMLETGKISEEEFDARERVLLDRLDAIEERGAILGGENEEEHVEEEPREE